MWSLIYDTCGQGVSKTDDFKLPHSRPTLLRLLAVVSSVSDRKWYRRLMLQLFQSYSREIVGIFTVVLAFGLNRVFRPQAKLVYSVRHAFTFLVDEPLKDADGNQITPTQTINTASISISNLGIQPAKKVEITFNWKPMFLNVWPARHYDTKDAPSSRYSIILENMAPNEVFGMEILSINASLPGITSVRSEDCVATLVPMIPQPIQPRWRIILASALVVVGLAGTGYLIAALIQLLARVGG